MNVVTYSNHFFNNYGTIMRQIQNAKNWTPRLAGVGCNVERNTLRAIIWLLIGGVGLTGCFGTSSALQSWVGKSEIELIKQWGKPDTVNTFDSGEKIYTWIDLNINNDGPHTCQKSVTISVKHTITKSISRGCPSVVSYH